MKKNVLERKRINYFKNPLSIEVKSRRLTSIAESVLNDPVEKIFLTSLCLKLNLHIQEIIDAFLKYNLNVFEYGNEIYDSLPLRMVLHIHNLVKDSWHQERQKTALSFIKLVSPKNMIDMGFGEPSLYVKTLLSRKTTKITLCDFSDTAFTFARALLDLWNPFWHEIVSFQKLDMNHEQLDKEFELYLFQDSIEHLKEPRERLLSYINRSSPGAKFLLSLPIGPISPSHFIEWKTEAEAKCWIESIGLKSLEEKIVTANPEIDLFAEQFNFNMKDYYVLCERK